MGPPLVEAIASHADYMKIPRDTPIKKAIYACDELVGFVGACVEVRPSKKLADLPVESAVNTRKKLAEQGAKPYLPPASRDARECIPSMDCRATRLARIVGSKDTYSIVVAGSFAESHSATPRVCPI